jgi:hypothetical protein
MGRNLGLTEILAQAGQEAVNNASVNRWVANNVINRLTEER